MKPRSLNSNRAAKYSVRRKRVKGGWIVSTWDSWFGIFVDSEPMSYDDALKASEFHKAEVRSGKIEGNNP